MNILIVEDEAYLADQLEQVIRKIEPSIQSISKAHAVHKTVELLQMHPDFDLIFMDIYLADGLAFEVFEKVNVYTPVIFTTAFDQYAIKAFEVNSIDYLLKPIRKEAVQKAISKYHKLSGLSRSTPYHTKLMELADTLSQQKRYKKHFLIPHKNRLIPLHADDFRYFHVSNGVVLGITVENKHFVLDKSLDELSEDLDPVTFYRANRQFLVHRDAVQYIEYYFNGRLSLNLSPVANEHVLVSKVKATEFKNWMNTEAGRA